MKDGVTVAGISGDGPSSHQQFSDAYNISYPLLCDTAQEVMEELGVIHEEKDGLRRVPQRSMVLIDGNHRVRWKWIAGDNWDDWPSDPISALQDTIDGIRASQAEPAEPEMACPKCGSQFGRTDTWARTGYEILDG